MNKKTYIQVAVHLFRVLCLSLFFLLCTVAESVTAQDATEAGKKFSLVVAVSDSFPPVSMLDEEGNVDGFGRDLSMAIARAVDAEVQYIHSPSRAEVLEWFAEGRADLIYDAGYIGEPDASFDYSVPILEMPEVIFVRSETYDINGLDSLKDKRIACVEDHNSYFYIADFSEKQCVKVHSALEGLYHVISGDVDAFVFPKQIILYQAQKLRLGSKIKIAGEPLRTLELSLAVKKGNKDVLDLLNNGIQMVKESGEYDRIYQRWFGTHVLSGYSRNEVLAIVAFSTGFAITIILVATLWFFNVRLRKGKESLEAAYSENIRTNEKLRQSEENFRLIFDNANDGIIIADIETKKHVMSNRTICDMLGYTPEELLDLWVTDIHPRDSMPFVMQQFENVVHGSQNLVSDIPVQRKDGSVFPADIHASRFVLNGKTHLIGLFRDVSERKEAEFQFRTIVETAHDAFWLVDMEGKILDANEAACRMLGYPRDEFLGMHINEIDAMETPEETEARISTVIDAGSACFEVTQRKKDGTIIDVEVSTNLIRNQRGKAVFYSFLRDITERKQAERALRESEGKIRTLLENIPQKIFYKDTDCVYVSCNENFAHDRNIKKEDIAGKTDFDFFPGHLARKYREDDKRILRSGEVEEIEEQYIADGQEFVVSTIKTPVRDIHGDIVGILGVFHDITERKLAERALMESEERVRLLLDSTGEGIYGLDIYGNCTFANASCLRMLGFEKEEDVLGRNMHNLIHHTRNDGTVYPERECQIYEAFRKGEGTHGDDEVLWRKDGSSFPTEYWSYPIRREGEVIGSVVAFMDISERKRAENEIRESRQMLKQVLDSIPVRVFWKDRNSVYLGCNRLFAEDAGLASPDEIFGKSDFEMVWSENAEMYRGDDSFVIRSGTEKLNYEESQVDPSGKSYWVRTSKVPLLDAENRIIGVLGTYEDITDIKKAEEDLRLKAQVIDQIHDSVVSTDLHGYITGWNRGAVRLYGYSAEEVIGEHMEILYPEDEIMFLRESVIAPLMESGAHDINVRTRRKSGDIFFAHLSMSLFTDSKGETAGMVAYSMDITDRVRAEEKLKESERDLQTLINTPGDAILLLDADGTVNYVNQEIARLHGVNVEELKGRNIFKYLPRELAGSRKAVADQVIASGEPVVFEDKQDGSIHENRVFPVFNEEGKAVKLAIISRDISDRKMAEEELRQRQAEIEDLNRTLEQRVLEVGEKNRQKDMLIMQQSRLASMGEMIGHIAHQWRQPLNALNLIIFNIKHFHDEGELSDETLSSLTSKGNLLIQKMSHTIDDFRNFFRPDRARQEFSINDMVRNSIALLEASFKHHDISIEIEESGDVRLTGFSNEYSQVLLNVLNNARGAIIEHGVSGHIQLEIKAEGNEGVLLVRDNGGGIPEKLLGRIFEPYFTTRDEGQGTGLGLYMSKIIIEEHMRGHLSARNLNGGAEIRITVPQARSEVNRGQDVTEVEHDRNG